MRKVVDIMLSRVLTVTGWGIDPVKVIVEVSIDTRSLPYFDIVGLPTKGVSESKYRIKQAILNSGYKFPTGRIVVNLSPADLPKYGTQFDLPIALGILSASMSVDIGHIGTVVGELSLSGDVLSSKIDFLALLMSADEKIANIIIPSSSQNLLSGLYTNNIFLIRHLSDLKKVFHSNKSFSSFVTRTGFDRVEDGTKMYPIMDDVIGMEIAKRAFLYAAAGGHNLLLTGPPGIGKSFLAKAFKNILPVLNREEIIELTKIYSCISRESVACLVSQRPFRTPHHTISTAGMFGGGVRPLPGEVTLAHRGVLFLDEFTDYPSNIIESLRQVMDDRKIMISRNTYKHVFPADFSLVACANPCHCGYFGSDVRQCRCSINDLNAYQRKFSGPLLDRIDIKIHVSGSKSTHTTPAHSLTHKGCIEMVSNARTIQLRRYGGDARLLNSTVSIQTLEQNMSISSTCKKLLESNALALNLSYRSQEKILRVLQTIADSNGKNVIDESVLYEGLLLVNSEFGLS